MKLRLCIDCDNASFRPNPNVEIARIMRDIAERFEKGQRSGTIRDQNGNTVGHFGLTAR